MIIKIIMMNYKKNYTNSDLKQVTFLIVGLIIDEVHKPRKPFGRGTSSRGRSDNCTT